MTSQESNIVWKSSSWYLREEEKTYPNGEVIRKGIVVHPGSVVLVPLRPTDAGYEVIMIRQFRTAVSDTILELPAGTREGEDEDWLICAQRELREETGYRAANLIDLGKIWPAPGVSSELMGIFLATDLTHDPLPADIDEEIELAPMLLDELVEMCQDGRMMDGKTVIALWRTLHHLATSTNN